MPTKPQMLIPANACKIPTLDHRDRDFLKSFHPEIIKFGAAAVPIFPDEFDTDAGLWMPNQNIVNPEFPKSPAEPFGCTNFTQADISADLDGKLRDPAILEALTHANANGGYQVRDSLLMAKRIGWITGFYNVKAYAPLDYFDALRLASFSGLPEKRSVSMGTPWGSYQWNPADKIVNIIGELTDKTSLTMPWHNWKVAGWKQVNGSPYLKCKPWMGPDVGIILFGRAEINRIMALKYTIAFTATHTIPQSIVKIDMAVFDKFYSYLRTLVGLRY